jgi:hypothetical protein
LGSTKTAPFASGNAHGKSVVSINYGYDGYESKSLVPKWYPKIAGYWS